MTLLFRGALPTGARGEQIAARFLRRAGYRVLASNLRLPSGEIDILAEAPDGRTIVVVEVKSALEGEEDLPPEVHVNGAKQRKLVLLATQVARRRRLTDRPIRFDVIGINIRPGQEPAIRHHLAAFESHV